MVRADETALTYIPGGDGSKTTGNMIVGDFTERNVGAETRAIETQKEGRKGGREGERCAGRTGAQQRLVWEVGKGKTPFQLLPITDLECGRAERHPGDHNNSFWLPPTHLFRSSLLHSHSWQSDCVQIPSGIVRQTMGNNGQRPHPFGVNFAAKTHPVQFHPPPL